MRALPVLLALAACAHAPPAPAPGPIELAPAPYTVEQIRHASRVGRTYEFLNEEAGKPNTRHVMTFVAVTDTTAQLRDEVLDEHGALISPATMFTATWEELHHHGEFPVADLKVTETSVTVPVGSFSCRRYSVKRMVDGVETMTHYDFADGMPGPPIRYFVESQGKTIKSATLVRYLKGTK